MATRRDPAARRARRRMRLWAGVVPAVALIGLGTLAHTQHVPRVRHYAHECMEIVPLHGSTETIVRRDCADPRAIVEIASVRRGQSSCAGYIAMHDADSTLCVALHLRPGECFVLGPPTQPLDCSTAAAPHHYRVVQVFSDDSGVCPVAPGGWAFRYLNPPSTICVVSLAPTGSFTDPYPPTDAAS